MNAVHNEKVKLRANALDRASTATLTGGVVTPLAAVLFADARPYWAVLLLATAASALVSRWLHGLAISTRDDLKDPS